MRKRAATMVAMTVLSWMPGMPAASPPPVRVNCTGIRTGVASGKNRANSATVLVCTVRAFAVPICPKATTLSPRLVQNRVGTAAPSTSSGQALGCQPGEAQRLHPPNLIMRVGLPLFPVRKSLGEPEHAVMSDREARPRPQCGTEGLALRRYSFQQVMSTQDAAQRAWREPASQAETEVSSAC